MKSVTFLGFLFLIFATSGNAQSDLITIDKIDQIIYYDYHFYETAGNPASVKLIPMQLQIGAYSSKFCSTQYADKDSMLVAYEHLPPDQAFWIIWPQLMNMQSHRYARYTIFKQYPERGKMQFLAYHSGNNYLVEEDIQFNWKIHSERDTTIIGLRCLMATTRYGGRDYVAWFAPDIPISDGPYKFSGLPGIIVRIADTENEHVFELQGARYDVNQPMYYSTTPATRLSPKGYVKTFYEDIEASMEKARENPHKLHRLKNQNNLIERY